MDPAAVLTDEEVQNALAVLKKRLQPLLGDSLAKLVLYGSRARGDADPDSDVDVAIIVRGSDGKVRDRILNAVADVELETLALNRFGPPVLAAAPSAYHPQVTIQTRALGRYVAEGQTSRLVSFGAGVGRTYC